MRPYADGGRKRLHDISEPRIRMERPAVLISAEKLATLEWARSRYNGYAHVPSCAVCEGLEPGHVQNPPDREGHRPGCWMDEALNADTPRAA